MKRNELINQIESKKTMLCVGLDSDITKIPAFIRHNFDDPILEFNRRIILSTQDDCISYKFNIAFYESMGVKGWEALEKSLDLIPSDIFKIADAKRGDIGNTAALYAKTFFETFSFDAVTVSPYMGCDTLEPFYAYDHKWVIILGLTSNSGSQDFQMQQLTDGNHLYESIIQKCAVVGDKDNTMFVVGATKSEYLKSVRTIIPDHFLLMPGIGSQGGDLSSALSEGVNDDYGLLINSSRGIIYADSGENFEGKAHQAAHSLNEAIRKHVSFNSGS